MYTTVSIVVLDGWDSWNKHESRENGNKNERVQNGARDAEADDELTKVETRKHASSSQRHTISRTQRQ